MSNRLSHSDVVILNAARGILSGFSPSDMTAGESRAVVRAEVAEHAIFQFLNTYSVYVEPLTEDEVHGPNAAGVRALAEPVTPESIRV